MEDHDFGGYATMANRRCTDGRTIKPEAFAHQDKQTVPLVWQHGHDTPENVLGHVNLEKRDNGGTYAYAFFNDTPAAIHSKTLVEHGDVNSLSIYATRLKENSKKEVLHGNITEVSLVLSGANPGAKIDFVRLAHGDGEFETLEDEAVIFSGEGIELAHAAGTKTFKDVYDTLDEDQIVLFETMVAKALKGDLTHSDGVEDNKDGAESDTVEDKKDKSASDDDKDLEHKEGADIVARNAFEKNGDGGGSMTGADGGGGVATLNHSQVATIFADGVKMGSFKESLLAHAGEYGITNIDMLFPDSRAIDNKPEWITRKMAWVEGVLNETRKLPWSRIKSLSADLTHEEARAKGYVKATLKKEQFFAVAKRETTPQTIYKKQRLDRDDITDITDFDVVAWLWVEMYFMFREEAARAILVGDGREIDDPDKILETKIRPIAFDDPFYTDVVTIPANTTADGLVEALLRNRDAYKGTSPKAYMTNAVMTDMLLDKDGFLRRKYNTKAELAAAIGVSEIVEVPVMEGITRDGGEVQVIIVNLSDYAVGSTKGGEITKFDDFDIDYNQFRYLIEGRFSGALMSHKRAQIFVRGAGTLATPTVPTFNSTTGVLTIPTVTGVTYKNQLTNATLAAGAQTAIAPSETITVKAVANTGYYFPHNFDADWAFTRLP